MIHPVRNYKTEVECDPHMDILTLRVLRQILRYSKDFLKDKIERKREEDKLFYEKVKERYPELKGETSFHRLYMFSANIAVKSRAEKQPNGEKQSKEEGDEEDVKKWRVVKGSALIGCPGKRVSPGEIVTEVKPPEDDYVLVTTEDGKEGSLPVSCVGEQPVGSPLSLHHSHHLQRNCSGWSGGW